MRRKIVLLVMIYFGNIILILCLGWIGDSLRHTRYGFNRLFPPHFLEEGETIELPTGSYYLAGAKAGSVYLAASQNPLRVVVVDTSGYFFFRKLSVTYLKPEMAEHLRLRIEDSTFYLSNGELPVIIEGDLKSGRAQWSARNSTYFSQFVPIGSKTAAIRMMSTSLQREVLSKIGGQNSPVQTFPDLLEKQVDGVFCTDGSFLTDGHGHLVYIYYYRNQFIVMDTSLNLLYRGRTIDNVSHAQIKVAKVDGSSTLAEPPLSVNQQATISGHFLFVHSSLLAQNEDQATFDNASVIDIYDLKQGDYRFSFYIVNKGRKRITDFRVEGTQLYALFGNLLVAYQIKPEYFE